MLDIILDEFHFSTLWNGGILLFGLFAAIIYLFLLPEEKNHSIWKTILFFTALIVLFIAIGSPINVIARIKFSTHIIQLVLLLLVVPPLLIIGFKKKIIEKIRTISVLDKMIHMLTNPVVAIFLFQLSFYAYHIPMLFDYVRIDLFLNYIFLLGLFISALLLWIPIVSPGRQTSGQKLKYCITNSLLLIPFSLLLFFASDSIYTIYSDIDAFIPALALCLPDYDTLTPEFFETLLPFDPVNEQQLGGGILLVSQVVVFGGLLLLRQVRKHSYFPAA
ncbi:cytochrome c oxidase assembly protein [Virgibacillus sp. NKC19-3]|uniref:cytochrome c oxidase assembly protein n=1 Tax=Virgibacillus saliphilus TaxID=2831674 RepID=UPI001C9B4C5A|nr:cytochrome c oxidase assembly protein [Virgibacillus sp. NKC19-3]MBY7142965.1 cytochrome c oxidase assembly protein [Virgibacillus sp. NKC19-3]